MDNKTYELFKTLTYEGFKALAVDESRSCYEKIGFPDSYRQGKEQAIFQDILRKLPLLHQSQKVVVDIGCGCSEIPLMLIEFCQKNQHELVLIDSAEMLHLIPESPGVVKIPGYYPPECTGFIDNYAEKVDVLICYSVLHYVFNESNLFAFLDNSLKLLKAGGQFLIGDIPNISKRKRFFKSANGIRFHQKFMQTSSMPEVAFNQLEAGEIDDAVIFSILQRCRMSGFDAYVVPQPDELPMANRREDILISRP